MTIHASKGFEASDVVLYDGITSTVKEAMRVSERERKNEWRTWYVGLTRTSDRVHIMRGGFGWCSKFLPDDARRAPAAAGLEQQAREGAANDEVLIMPKDTRGDRVTRRDRQRALRPD